MDEQGTQSAGQSDGGGEAGGPSSAAAAGRDGGTGGVGAADAGVKKRERSESASDGGGCEEGGGAAVGAAAEPKTKKKTKKQKGLFPPHKHAPATKKKVKQVRPGKVDDRGIQRRPQPQLRGNTVTRMASMVEEAEYVIRPDGLRGVVPYYYTFVANAKRRWIGMTIAELFTTEFRGSTPEYIEQACANGRLLIQGQKVTPDFVLRDNDWMTHEMHRHEPPVLADEPAVVGENEVILAVNKPSSLPVHPCGRYRHNSVVFYLGHQGHYSLYPLYRLDRLTSGVLLMAKSSEASAKYSRAIANRNVSKEYVARVDGVFPAGPPITVDQPLLNVDPRIGQIAVDVGGKEARTTFELLSTNGTSSVVRCKPHTGRTHQIRVHLLHLGFPISNDPVYNAEYRAALKARATAEPETLVAMQMGPLDPADPHYDPICEVCSGQMLYKSSAGHTVSLWLHARQYQLHSSGGPLDTEDGEVWTFVAPNPDWAAPDFDVAASHVGQIVAKYGAAPSAPTDPVPPAAPAAVDPPPAPADT